MADRKKISLTDIAEHCGVSRATVGHIMSGKNRYKFKKETEELVRRTAAELNYRPNAYASVLRKQENRLILCVVGDVCRHSDMEHIKRLEYELGKRGYNLLVQFLMELPENVKLDFIERLINMPAGIAIWSLGITDEDNLARFRKLFENAPPSLSLSMEFPGSKIDYIQIRWGALSCARAAEFLAKKGFRSVCCCCTYEEKKFSSTFIESAARFNMNSFVLWADQGEKNYFERGLSMFKMLKERPALPQAIYCTSDDMAFVLIEEFRAIGIRVPEDLFILGGGDSAYSAYFHNPLPVLVHNSSLLCKTAADHLIGKIQSGETSVGTGECVAEIDCTFHEADALCSTNRK